MGQRQQHRLYDDLIKARGRILVHLQDRAQVWKQLSEQLAIVDDEIARDVANGRRLKMEWKEIAGALGLPRQTVQGRYAIYGDRSQRQERTSHVKKS